MHQGAGDDGAHGRKDWDAPREGERVGRLPDRTDARLVFIGRIRTPFRTRDECPRRGDLEGPVCQLDIDPEWWPALEGVEAFAFLEVLYWMHEARRDLLTQTRHGGSTVGTFALRSPVRPNPIATSVVRLIGIENGILTVRGLDCLDGTPLVDLKPDREGRRREA